MVLSLGMHAAIVQAKMWILKVFANQKRLAIEFEYTFQVLTK